MIHKSGTMVRNVFHITLPIALLPLGATSSIEPLPNTPFPKINQQTIINLNQLTQNHSKIKRKLPDS